MTEIKPGVSYLVYDGECPFCKRYVALVRLREAIGPVELVDARTPHPMVEWLRQKGFVIDEGMALVQSGEIHHGADCLHRLALLSTPFGFFNRLNAALFRSRTMSRLFYPWLRAGRNLALRLMGKRKLGY